jgi:hypothetical protein
MKYRKRVMRPYNQEIGSNLSRVGLSEDTEDEVNRKLGKIKSVQSISSKFTTEVQNQQQSPSKNPLYTGLSPEQLDTLSLASFLNPRLAPPFDYQSTMDKPPSIEIRESIGKTRGLTPNLTRSKPVINTKWTRNLNPKEHTYQKVKVPSKKKVPKISKYDADADTSSLEAKSAPTTTDPHKKELIQIAEQMRDLYELQKRSNNMF